MQLISFGTYDYTGDWLDKFMSKNKYTYELNKKVENLSERKELWNYIKDLPLTINLFYDFGERNYQLKFKNINKINQCLQLNLENQNIKIDLSSIDTFFGSNHWEGFKNFIDFVACDENNIPQFYIDNLIYEIPKWD